MKFDKANSCLMASGNLEAIEAARSPKVFSLSVGDVSCDLR